MSASSEWKMADFSLFVFPYQRASLPLASSPYVDLAQKVEEFGFYEIALPHANGQALSTERADGPFDPKRTDRLVIFDPLLLTPIIATATKTLRFGMHSAALPLLHPFYWARFFATLDVMTGGRVDAGMCIGGVPREFEEFGISMKTRGRMADESVDLIKRLWVEDNVSHAGEFFRTSGATVDPKPVQKPHPPIWWGGGAASIPRAVRSCDRLLMVWPTVSMLQEEIMPRVREEGRKQGRQIEVAAMIFAEVVTDKRDVARDVLPKYRSMDEKLSAHAVGSPERVAEVLSGLRKAGVTHFMLDLNRHGVDPLDKVTTQLDLFKRYVVPLLA